MNQFNAFEVVHDATAVGGKIFHILPVTGHTDHGYVHYTSRFFFDLAEFNGYEIVHASFDAGGSSMLFDSLRSYAPAYPMLADIITKGVRMLLINGNPSMRCRIPEFESNTGRLRTRNSSAPWNARPPLAAWRKTLSISTRSTLAGQGDHNVAQPKHCVEPHPGNRDKVIQYTTPYARGINDLSF
jgi:hypothetical protein